MDVGHQHDKVPLSDASYQHNAYEGIDLISLLNILWEQQKKIWLSTGVFFVLGISIAFILPQRWTSQAIITAPENQQLTELQSMLVNFETLGINSPVDADALYLNSLKRFDSQSLLQTYLSSSKYIRSQLEGNANSPEHLHQAVVNAAKNFKMHTNNNHKDEEKNAWQSWTLTYTASSAIAAQDVLSGYIRYVADKVKLNTVNDIRAAVLLEIKREENKLQLDINNLIRAHQNKIKRLQYSLDIANAAGIKQPVYSKGQAVKDEPDYPVALGADGIQEKLKVEQAQTDVTQMDTDIQNRQYRLKQLKAVNIDDINFSTFSYQQDPTLPVSSNSPCKFLIVISCTLFGTLLSCVAILLYHAIVEHKRLRFH